MEMTIDEVISDLTELKICGVVPFTKGTISGGNYKVITGDCVDEAIHIIHKYQKIQEIVRNHDVDNMPEDYWYIDKIREVLEDGKID